MQVNKGESYTKYKQTANKISTKIRKNFKNNKTKIYVVSALAGIFILSYVLFAIYYNFQNFYSWEYGKLSNARLELIGDRVCKYYQFEKVYQIRKIKNIFWDIDCIRIKNNQFQMQTFQVFQSTVEGLGFNVTKT